NVLIKGGRALEQLAAMDTVVFDKTGTLTAGTPEVVDVQALAVGCSPLRVLQLAAAAERGLKHPAADAILRAAQAQGIDVPVHGVIGDGINDSPALAYADVSLSLKAGTDVARETADVVLHGDLHDIVDAVDIARESVRLIRQNLAIVAVPNAAGLALATAGFV